MPLKNNQDIRVVMLAASLPPMPAGGAEMQALRLAEELSGKGIEVIFITPGKPGLKGMTRIGGVAIYRLHSWMNGLFTRVAAFRKKRPTENIRVEYDDSKEITTRINKKVGWPTVIYYNIFYLHALFFLRRKRMSLDIIHAHTMEWSAVVAARLGKALNKP